MAAALEPLASTAAPAPSLEELWRAAWESHGGALHAYLRRRLSRPDEADDLLQETFVRAIRARAGGLAPESIRAYLFTTAHRLLIDRAQRASEMLFSELGDDADAPWIQVAAPATDSPELATRRRRFAERLLAALDTLPPAHRRAFELAVLRHLPYAEIARRERWSAEQVRVNLHRARRKLLAVLGAELGELQP